MSLKILSAKQTQTVDAQTIETERIQSVELMERASQVWVNAFMDEVSDSSPVTVLAGPGNNGGDGLAIARLLHQAGYDVQVYLVRESLHSLSKDCNENIWRWRNIPGVFFSEINDSESLQKIKFRDVIIDAIFGSGLNRPLSGIYRLIVEMINIQNQLVYAVDIPSGLYAEENTQEQNRCIVRASLIWTFQLPKLSFLLPENGIYAPDFRILNIGLSEKSIQEQVTPYYFIQKEDIAGFLPVRPKFGHKGTFGHVLLVVGQYGKMGAAVIASSACLHSGAGLVTVHCPACGMGILQTAVPEAMVDVDVHERVNTSVVISDKHTIAIGPGIGQDDKVQKMLFSLLNEANQPLVLDADALNVLAVHPDWLSLVPCESILTPHPTEFERLVGEKFKTGYQRLQHARKKAQEWRVIIVLKGAYTAVVLPSGDVFFNSTGNPGMATAGSGDCLTGIVSSLLAQGLSPSKAALCAVFLHGLAGDIALEADCSAESLTATEIINHLGKAFRQIRS